MEVFWLMGRREGRVDMGIIRKYAFGLALALAGSSMLMRR